MLLWSPICGIVLEAVMGMAVRTSTGKNEFPRFTGMTGFNVHMVDKQKKISISTNMGLEPYSLD